MNVASFLGSLLIFILHGAQVRVLVIISLRAYADVPEAAEAEQKWTDIANSGLVARLNDRWDVRERFSFVFPGFVFFSSADSLPLIGSQLYETSDGSERKRSVAPLFRLLPGNEIMKRWTWWRLT